MVPLSFFLKISFFTVLALLLTIIDEQIIIRLIECIMDEVLRLKMCLWKKKIEMEPEAMNMKDFFRWSADSREEGR